MKIRKQSGLILIYMLLSGCTATKALEQSGEQLSQGNIIAGLWTGTMGVAMGAVIDVFTLGGTASVDEGAKALTTAATDYSDSKSKGGSSTEALITSLTTTAQTVAAKNSTDAAMYSSTSKHSSATSSAASSAFNNTPNPSKRNDKSRLPNNSKEILSSSEIGREFVTADGFDFQIKDSYKMVSSSGGNGLILDDTVIIAYGGPCRTANIDYMGIGIESASRNAYKPEFVDNKDYQSAIFVIGPLHASGGHHLPYGVLQFHSEHPRRVYEADKKYKSSRVEESKETYETHECMERTHMYYVHAMHHWVAKNKKAVQKKCMEYITREKRDKKNCGI